MPRPLGLLSGNVRDRTRGLVTAHVSAQFLFLSGWLLDVVAGPPSSEARNGGLLFPLDLEQFSQRLGCMLWRLELFQLTPTLA